MNCMKFSLLSVELNGVYFTPISYGLTILLSIELQDFKFSITFSLIITLFIKLIF